MGWLQIMAELADQLCVLREEPCTSLAFSMCWVLQPVCSCNGTDTLLPLLPGCLPWRWWVKVLLIAVTCL